MSNDTPQDARIRALMVELSESSPLAPTAEELGLSTQPVTVDDHGALPSYTEVSSMVVKDSPKPRRLFAGLAAALTMVVGGSLAFNVASNNGQPNPEAAVEQLLDAMVEEDAIGMIESIDPDERRAITPHIDELIAELERVELLSGVDSGSVSGFDFAYQDLELASRQLGDGVWAVGLVDGTFSSSTSAGALPIGAGPSGSDEIGEFAVNLDEWIASWPELFASADFELVVTNDDGWHVSVVYTFMEQIRKTEGWPAPDYSIPLTPSGAPSPEEAAEAWLVAQGNWDVRAIIDLLDPVEMPAIHRYVEQLAEVVERDEFFGSTETGVVFEQTRVDGDGDSRTVVIEQFQVTQRYEGFDATPGAVVTSGFDGRCRTIEARGSEPVGENPATCVDEEDLASPTQGFIAASPIEIRVVERNGAWFVSPVGTVVDAALDGLRVRGTDGFDGQTVFLTLFEIPVLPIFAPGGATGLIANEDFAAIDEGMAECTPGIPEDLRTEEEAALAADEYRACLAAFEFGPAELTEIVALTTCSYIWTFESTPDSLDAALSISEEFTMCLVAEGADSMMGTIVGDFYCSELAENEGSEPGGDTTQDCREQFGLPEPLPVPVICEEVFAQFDDAEPISEEEFNALEAEFPECFAPPVPVEDAEPESN